MLTQALHGGKASELAVRRKEAQWEQVLTSFALLAQKYNPEASKLSTRFSDASRRKRRRSIARSCCYFSTSKASKLSTSFFDASRRKHSGRRYSVYLLYWCKSTNLDAAGAFRARHRCSICVLTYAHVCSRMLTYAGAASERGTDRAAAAPLARGGG
jgi:hypothetical protein